MKHLAGLFSAFVILIGCAPHGGAVAGSSDALRFHAVSVRVQADKLVLAPLAHLRFCLAYPEDCKSRRNVFRPGPVRITQEKWSDLVAVNNAVNRSIRPQRNTGGVAGELWLVNPTAGDCNDYAVTKQHELLRRGWPARSVLLAEVVVDSGQHHLVLVVRTNRGDLVLDNLTSKVQPWADKPFQWVRMQTTFNPRAWTSVATRTS